MKPSATVTERTSSVQQSEDRPISIKRAQGWEALGIIALVIAAGVAAFGFLEWAQLIMLFAIYCAAMR